VAAVEEVLTVDGWVQAGDLRVEQEVLTAAGEMVPIVGIIRRPNSATFRIEFSDRSTLAVGGDQALVVQYRGNGPGRAWVTTTKTVRELIDIGVHVRTTTERKWKIPVPAPLDLPQADLPVDPYVLGSWVANGYAGTCAAITTPDPAVIARLQMHDGVLVKDTTPVCPRLTMRGLISHLRDLHLDVRSAGKFIPAQYLLGSLQQRVDLLHGLMDGDGSGSVLGRSNVRYHTISKKLADDVVKLVSTLGGTGVIHRTDRTHEDKGIEFVVSVMLPPEIEPFFTPAKSRGTTKVHTEPRRAITKIEPGETAELVVIVTEDEGSVLVGQQFVTVSAWTSSAELVLPAA
jgi:hypothetical protein